MPTQNSTDNKLSALLEGIKTFQTRFYEQNPAHMRDLVENGQHPKVLLISCSDSRVDPSLLTAAQPGDLFTIRNVANLVPPYRQAGEYDGARAAIEYAVRDLEVEHIIILGHAHCGGIKALLGSLSGHKPQRDFIGEWVSVATDACCKYVLDKVKTTETIEGQSIREIDISQLKEHQHLVERAAIQGSIDNLNDYPWISERILTGKLALHGWWFDLDTGDLWTTDNPDNSFLPVID